MIYQGAFAEDGWHGRADFLERVPRPSDLGEWGYEAVDTKLSRAQALPHHVLQLSVYSQAIERRRASLPSRCTWSWGRGVATRSAWPTSPPTCAEPRRPCGGRWTSRSRPSRTRARIARSAAFSGAAGIAGERRIISRPSPASAALTSWSCATPASRRWRRSENLEDGVRVPGIRAETLAGLRHQARLQVRSRDAGTLEWEARADEAGRGLERLPAPSDGDVYLDLEGNPSGTPDHELTFLFGLVARDGGAWRYEAFWGHDAAGEREALAGLIDRLTARLAADPGMHVYHYSPAEPSAAPADGGGARRSRGPRWTSCCAREVFVDLYTVRPPGLRRGRRGYGLKVTRAPRQLRAVGDPRLGHRRRVGLRALAADGDAASSTAIAAYNEEDCRATLALRDWLSGAAPRRNGLVDAPRGDPAEGGGVGAGSPRGGSCAPELVDGQEAG